MKKRSFAILFIVTLLYGIASYGYVPILSSHADSLGATASMVGLIGGIYGGVSIVLRLPFSFLSDYLQKRKAFIVLACAMTVLSSLLPCLWATPVALFLSRFLGGIALSAWVHFTIMFTSYFPPERKAFAVGLVNALMTSGNTIGALLCGFTVPNFGTISIYLTCLGISVIALLLAMFGIEEKLSKNDAPLSVKELFSVVKVRNVFFLSILGAVALCIFCATGPSFTPLIAKKYLHADAAWLSILATVIKVFDFAACLFIGFFAAAFSRKQILVGGLAILAAGTVTIPFMPNMIALIAVQSVVIFFGNLLTVYLQVLVLEEVSYKMATAAIGFYQTIYSLGITFGPIGTGLVLSMTGNYTVTFALLALLPLGALLVTVFRNLQPGEHPAAQTEQSVSC